ncbi:PhnD/SsuA/transferrin family substrate-binding protein [Massilia sp. CCM 8695]|uniref:PhnD/SsuA/transferrin family substrate-binding protein n=1 Tax=Massilia frigida TaxID=2609281 RepID=A0ABX0NGX9_9BURK|nr:PhnD/SsuA/transferrin family substrate-binding protein [Massilia frigida]NHZ82339.1 PhnD/SsuA/transferrin family substrate-binding protein [Massilia frigida]
MNALRHAVAALAREGRFFGALRWSGSHRASLALVRSGAADLAAIDCVTLGYLRRDEPSSLDGLAILCHSAPSPALPFVSGAAVPAAVRACLRGALLAPAPELASLMAALSIAPSRHAATTTTPASARSRPRRAPVAIRNWPDSEISQDLR